MDTIEEKLRDIIDQHLVLNHSDEVKSESRFIEDLGMDSLDTVELIMAVEVEFNIEISDDDAEKIKTFDEAVAYLEGRLK